MIIEFDIILSFQIKDAKSLPPSTLETIYCTTLHLNMLYGNILCSNVKLQTIIHAKKKKEVRKQLKKRK